MLELLKKRFEEGEISEKVYNELKTKLETSEPEEKPEQIVESQDELFQNEEEQQPDLIPEQPDLNTIANLRETMAECNWSDTDLGQHCVNVKKWKLKAYSDLTSEMIEELIDDIKKKPK